MTADSSGPRALLRVNRKHFLVCAALVVGGAFLKTRLPHMGLPLYREYASRAGGSLHAENLPEGGSRFVLVLPEAPTPAAVA